MTIYFVLLFQALIASGTHIVAKMVVNDIEPVTLTMIRSLMAMAGLVVIALIRKTSFAFERKDLKALAILSILAIPLNQFLFLTAIKLTTPANAALLYGTTPAVVLLLSRIAGQETISKKKGIGVAIAFCGVVIIVFQRGIDFHSNYMVGNLLMYVAVIAWALYTVRGRPLILKYGAFPTSAATMILGTVFFLPLGLFRVVHYDFSAIDLSHWGGLLYLSMGTSIFSYFLWYYALGRIEASKVAIFANLQPILTTVLAFFLLGQAITPAFVVGGVVALSGVVVTQVG
jgi:drug/metabolite transporter (DMT)-like permease